MGDRPLAWQASIGEMIRQDVRAAFACHAGAGCKVWINLDLAQLYALHGPDFSLWDRLGHCPICCGQGHFMASVATGTPFMRLSSRDRDGPAERVAFLKSFGFTKRDVARIKAFAERVGVPGASTEALSDLDAPFRISACPPGENNRSTGNVLGEWKGRKLLFWPLSDRELESWRRRRPGPRGV